MAWLTTKDGRHFNTDWINKEKQIAKNKEEADKLNHAEDKKYYFKGKRASEDEFKRLQQIAKNQEEADRLNGKVTRLTSNDDPSKLREELKDKLLDENSYMRSEEYKTLSEDLHKISEEVKQLHDRQIELWKIQKEDTKIDAETLADFGGDRTLARLFGTKGEKALAAEKELKEIGPKIEKAEKAQEKAQRDFNAYKSVYSQDQKEQFEKDAKEGKLTISTDVKKDYKGFELDTHTPYAQNLYEKGQAYMVEMAPKEYLRRCGVEIFEKSTYENQVFAVMVDAKHTYELADMMAKGTKMYMPVLDYKNTGQEGRHRAAAAVLNGISRIPVMIIPRRK